MKAPTYFERSDSLSDLTPESGTAFYSELYPTRGGSISGLSKLK
jgi:hypothetical protein